MAFETLGFEVERGSQAPGASQKIISIRYLDERLTFLQILLTRGFRIHAGYWGEADASNCYNEQILEQWLPSAQRTARWAN